MLNNLLKKGLFFLVILTGFFGQAQIHDPVEWEAEVNKISEDEYELIMSAFIEDHWHLYSQHLPEGGALPTVFIYEEVGDKYELLGDTEESEPITEYDNVFEMDLSYFNNNAFFTQKIKLTDTSLGIINAKVEYQVCDDEACIFQTENFEFVINEEARGEVVTHENNSTKAIPENTGEVELANPDEKRSFWGIFIVAFLSGFAALLTPCVFPMIPMTVSFFTKQSKSRAAGIKNATFYGISIVVIYVLLGTLVTVIFGADALNALSTNVWFNTIFFVLLVIFAISFMGAFEIVLPSSWGTKIDSKADKGGLVGIFFMALALAIVSFSCTGPIVGTLLVEAASKGGIAPIIGMLGFSLAIALPFGLFAAFPGWLNSLPRSGGWLNTVKVTLGFLELALAFKFLSNADLVLQLHILEREIFLAIWIAIFGMLALYLFGKIQLPHDSKVEHISVGRLMTGLVVLIFTIYLIPGLWGAPLKLISGFPPPLQYSESPDGIGNSKVGTVFSEGEGLPDGAEYGPHDIVSFHDYEDGLAYAKEKDLPILVDFTGHACVNCRKMEERVWSEPQILQTLKEELVLISLYVDDKRKLPENEQYVSETTGKEIESIGNKWSDFQITRYKANAQPYYVLLDHEEEMLIAPSGYEPDADEYYSWLKKGIKNFNKDSSSSGQSLGGNSGDIFSKD
ncbi:protein-disulfide reductase DsbD family protein [Christiangramia forsetii]|uniref:Thiol:disulfide interchange protein DsbD 2 n=2 Tax=Christiangramia forsetii TaxID=411153 RepID=A0M5S2_CHRFK|nr:thioredoxin family protein [Christiangramia forsetii]GGG32325.1 thiol:disulfide interchange protein DsbD [Christiangramia forsetii]CAL67967.1 thiol:disulfide interchange protein DsbD 2 [Christiangramia forsetii KT0803]